MKKTTFIAAVMASMAFLACGEADIKESENREQLFSLEKAPCGDRFCEKLSPVCEIFSGGPYVTTGPRVSYQCNPLPSTCAGKAKADCACVLSEEWKGWTCNESSVPGFFSVSIVAP